MKECLLKSIQNMGTFIMTSIKYTKKSYKILAGVEPAPLGPESSALTIRQGTNLMVCGVFIVTNGWPLLRAGYKMIL